MNNESSPISRILLNLGHAMDHMFLLIFATAVTSISRDFGISRWEDLMPYSAIAFFCFGLGSLPSGRLGDLWGRRKMMIVFFISLGFSALIVGFTNSPLQLSAALALLGCAASIYHPVGIPMLLQGAQKPGWTIGINGLSGNLGLAVASALTGLLMKYWGWRMAFIIPGIISIVCGLLFAWLVAPEPLAPAQKKTATTVEHGLSVQKILFIMTLAATCGGMLFNFSTNGNHEMLSSKFADFSNVSEDPAQMGLLLAAVYVIASFAQLVIGYLLDRIKLKTLYLGVILIQITMLITANYVNGWAFYIAQIIFMAAIFGAIPFTDAMMVRFVDDSMRSRVSGMRLAVSLGASSLAVWLIGPIVKAAGFDTLIWVMVATASITLIVVGLLPTSASKVQRT